MMKAKIAAVFYRLCVFAALSIAAVSPAAAVQPDEILHNPQLESRARALSAQLRCLVCRNENIDDSNAPLARDLRLLVRERLQAGDSDSQVLDFMAARYGSYVLLKPPFFSAAMILWLFPPLLFLAAALYLLYAWRAAKRRRAPLPSLTAAEEARLKALLAEEEAAPGAESGQRANSAESAQKRS